MMLLVYVLTKVNNPQSIPRTYDYTNYEKTKQTQKGDSTQAPVGKRRGPPC